MKMNSSIIHDQIDGEKDDKGFTLIEILIAIVLVGILSAVAVVGISSLVKKGSDTACSATRDSAVAASAVYFAANNNTNPVDFYQLTLATASIPAALTLPTGVTPVPVAGTYTSTPPVPGTKIVASGTSWTLTFVQATPFTAVPTFTCT
jgi:prepilin-type N-terminal cleavage/methylation domain-containing protein